MANVTINGVDYSDVPAIKVPITNDNNNSLADFYDTSGDTATAADVASGKTFHGANGADVGTASGGTPSNLQASKSATPKETSVTVSPDTGYDAMEQVVVSPDNMALMASKSASDVNTKATAVLIDFENGFSQNTFYGWCQYFRSNAEDPNITAADFSAPKFCKIKLPKNITAIGGRAFSSMSGLCEVEADLDNGVLVNARAFSFCVNLETVGNLWSKITSVNGNSFRIQRQGNGSSSIFEYNKDIVAPMLTEVAGGSNNGYSMSRCAFKSFTAPLLQNVGSYMFAWCYYLQTVDLTAVTSIEAGAFSGCPSLTDVYLRNTSRVVTLQNTNAFSTPYQVTVHVPSNLLQSYLNDTNWSASGVTIVAI